MEGITKKLEELKKLKEETIKQINEFSNNLDIAKTNYQRIEGAIVTLEDLLVIKEEVKE